MDESVAVQSRVSALWKAVHMDRPWELSEGRQTLFLTALLSGLIAGALEGALICEPWSDDSFWGGDALFWDTVACGAWMGAGAGIGAGVALILSRNLWVRLTLGGLFGVVTLPAALLLSSKGNPIGCWEMGFWPESWSLLARPLDWGLLLGAPFT